MNKLVETYCDVEDFSTLFFPSWQRILLENGEIKRRRVCRLSPSEVMTIIIHFHQSHYRDFKNYYLHYVCRQLKAYFPELLSYTRFLALMPSVVVPMCSYLTSKLGKPTGIQFVDSTKIEVCHIIRAKRNKVFEGVAHHGKGTMGWSYGFKLHLIINHLGEIVALKLTTGNVDDREPVSDMADSIFGKLYGDKGYISKALSGELLEKGVELITTVRKNMKKKFISLWDRALLKKRFIIETVNDQLKNISYIEHSRHRSMHGFMLNLLGGLIAYCLKEEKPSLDLTSQELEILESNNLMLA
ncbi:IS982 family transposase [Pseudoalteromonas tetraodonis]|jgi:transposase|uniref:IS982 family transposase n=1 Tax=Pseudoalteromonas TaxID=53246 RepID=UPI001BDE10BB|nr:MULTISPECIES: IS982 family transposase [Pseudoalteromonas]MBT2153168.1 IS982 family transposase [Pseudoalteromonas tetraodonis]MCK8137225.1 IS982 family transposase [Pseudoalteromonas sp. 2CM28B]